MFVIYKLLKQIRTGLLVFVLFIPDLVFCQSQKGRVLSNETNSGIGFVNIGVIGKNIGTVSDELGHFMINIDTTYNNDSIRFSMIGYKTVTFLVSRFKDDSIKIVFLNPISYELKEVKVTYSKSRERTLGVAITSGNLISGFKYNDPGAEMGIKAEVKKQLKLTDLHLNVSICTFDSVFYRLKIYQLVNDEGYKNILNQPIYISFSKDKINKVVTVDLSKYSIVIEGSVLITLELYKNLGEGRLLFYSDFENGSTYHRKTSEGQWTIAPVAIGMYLHGLVIK
jgi:hypothetical protein